MARVLVFVFSTSGLLTFFLIGSLWIWRRGDSIVARTFLLGTALAYALASTFVVPFAISQLLTARFHAFTPADVGPGRVVVVVLGSGNTTVSGRDQQISVMLPNEAARVLEAVRVFHLIAPERIISSGGKPDPDEVDEPSGITMRDELVRFGVPAARILLESASRNTHEEAVVTSVTLRQMGVMQIVIVTSDTHMARSLGAFRAQGWSPVPATAPRSPVALSWREWLLPSGQGLEFSAEVAREMFGIPYYWARGWWRS